MKIRVLFFALFTALIAVSAVAAPSPKSAPKAAANESVTEESMPEGMSDVSDTQVEAHDAEAMSVAALVGFPRYASLKKTEVNVRSGPGNQYPILWIYVRAGYPVQLLAKYDNYYKLRDVEGEEGWVYMGMVSKRLTGLVGGKEPLSLYKKPEPDARVVARLSPGVIVELDECENGFCRVEVEGYKGYVAKARLDMVE